MTSNGLKTIDLFCGAGGLSQGFRRAGFQVLVANDIDEFARATFSSSHPDTKFLPGPIEQVGSEQILDAAGLEQGELDCLIGGPPCQGFSTAGGRDGSDPRNRLIFNYLGIVADLLPRWFLFENVEGILTSNGGESIIALIQQFVRIGYWVRIEKVNFAAYGLPQARKRVIIVGNRVGLDFALPEPTHSFDAGKHKSGSGLPRAPSLNDALAGLGAATTDSDSRVPYATMKTANSYDAAMRAGNRVGSVSLHYWSASDNDVAKYALLLPGQTMRDLPERFWHESFRRRAFRRVKDGTPTEKRGGAPSGFKRLQGHLNSLTITSATNREFIHPNENRPLTLREAARIQSFPDASEFSGPSVSVARQIGNAFPPLAAEIFARHLSRLDSGLGSGRAAITQSATPCLLGYRLTDSEGRSPALATTEALLDRLQDRQPSLALEFR